MPSRSKRPTTTAPSPSKRKTAAEPVPRTRALPHARKHVAERLDLLRRDDELARIAADDLVRGEAGRSLARLVEGQDPALAVENADERLRRLRESGREGPWIDVNPRHRRDERTFAARPDR